MSTTGSKVYYFDGGDQEMRNAYKQARANFRYFWREIAWEHRRIVPAFGLACVKAPFADGELTEDANVEHMWIGEVHFDGTTVTGTLLNEPNELSTISQGDSVSVPLMQISDWMYAINDEVYGGYTVNLLRSRMGQRERSQHDGAWGLDFGDPTRIRLMPVAKKKGGLLGMFLGSKPANPDDEHPMSLAMVPKLKEQLAKNPAMVREKDKEGWTLLHHEALAGNVATVEVLLDNKADANAVTKHGMTPVRLAKTLGWNRVVELLNERGGK